MFELEIEVVYMPRGFGTSDWTCWANGAFAHGKTPFEAMHYAIWAWRDVEKETLFDLMETNYQCKDWEISLVWEGVQLDALQLKRDPLEMLFEIVHFSGDFMKYLTFRKN